MSKICIRIHKNEYTFLNINDILYFEKESKYINVILINKKQIKFNCSIKLLINKLKENNLYGKTFFQTHCSYIININYVFHIQCNEIILLGGNIIPISYSKKNEVITLINKKIIGK